MAFNWSDPKAIQTARQKAIDAGYKPADVDKFIQQKTGESAQIQLSQQGVLDVADLAKSDPQAALRAVQQGAKPKVSEDKEAVQERTNQKKAQTALQALDRIQQNIAKDPNVILKKAIPGAPGARAFEGDSSSLIDIIGFLRTGATLTKEQQKLYENMLPKVGDSPETINQKLQSVKTELGQYAPQASGAGGQPQQQNPAFANAQNIQQQQPRQSMGDVLGGIFGHPQLPSPSLPDPGSLAKNHLAGAIFPNNPAAQTGDPISNKAFDFLMPDFAKSRNALGQGQLPTGDEAKGAGIESALAFLTGGGASLLGKAGGKVASNYTMKGIGASRDAAVAAAKDVKVPLKPLVEAGDEYVKHDPMAAKTWQKIKSGLNGKDVSIPDLMKKIGVWNDAYTAAGHVGKSAEAGINDVLAKAAKQSLPQDIAGANKQFSNLYKTNKAVKSLIPMAGLGAGGKGLELLWNQLFGGGGG